MHNFLRMRRFLLIFDTIAILSKFLREKNQSYSNSTKIDAFEQEK